MPNAYARPKNMLDERVVARLRSYEEADRQLNQGGYASSGSEHDGYSGLSGLIDGFFVDDDDDDDDGFSSRTFKDRDNDSDEEEEKSSDDRRDSFRFSSAGMIRDLISRPGKDRFKKDLVAAVRKAVELCADLRNNSNRSLFRRAVMESLRESGYNAGICKSKWESSPSGGLNAGTHEYLDVVKPSSSAEERYIVDLEFAAEFEIVRATDEYKTLIRELPAVFVGKADELKQLLRILTEGSKRSMRARDMHLPPWRKGRYLQAKWLGPYKRTTNATATSAASIKLSPFAATTVAPPSSLVHCRAVGFVPTERVNVPTPFIR